MEHAWKACMRDKRIVGSNPTSSVFFLQKKNSEEEKANRLAFVGIRSEPHAGGEPALGTAQAKLHRQRGIQHNRQVSIVGFEVSDVFVARKIWTVLIIFLGNL